jgi:hypothetical protein
VVCPACGAATTPELRFCLSCGTALDLRQLLGPDHAESEVLATEAKAILERLGARSLLARLETVTSTPEVLLQERVMTAEAHR